MSRGPPDRLKFRVKAVTSEDPDHPVTEVHLLAPHSRGWQSEKFCSYPQELLLDLSASGGCHVHQIQVLSHQHLISTKVDIYIMQKNGAAPGGGGDWVKLGHFVFESNEESGFAARELKTVKIDRKMTTKIKLALWRGYVNKHNIYNQVGIISVNLIGWPEDAVREEKSSHAPLQSRIGNQNMNMPNHHRQRDSSSGYAPSSKHHHAGAGGRDERTENYMLESSNKTGYNVGSKELVSLALDAGIDPFVMHIIREAHKHKQKAVMKEDYSEARRLRDGIERLKLIGKRVAELEGKKQKAVEQENYESAQVLKKDIDKLRQSCVSLGIGSMQAAHQQAFEMAKLQDANYKPKIIGQSQSQSQSNNAAAKLSSLGLGRRKHSHSKSQAQAREEGTKKELFKEAKASAQTSSSSSSGVAGREKAREGAARTTGAAGNAGNAGNEKKKLESEKTGAGGIVGESTVAARAGDGANDGGGGGGGEGGGEGATKSTKTKLDGGEELGEKNNPPETLKKIETAQRSKEVEEAAPEKVSSATSPLKAQQQQQKPKPDLAAEKKAAEGVEQDKGN